MASTDNPPAERGSEVVLFARVGPEGFILTATQVRDTVASYLARGSSMPTPTDCNGGDPYEPLHVIAEEWLWGNVESWVNGADVVHLVSYRHRAMHWIRSYFGPGFPHLED